MCVLIRRASAAQERVLCFADLLGVGDGECIDVMRRIGVDSDGDVEGDDDTE